MKFSIHSSLFNVVKMNFDYVEAIANWSAFLSLMNGFHEINLVVNTSEDNTLEVIKEAAVKYRKYNVVINVIESDIPYSDPAFDGKIKDVGFQASTGDINILVDLDEVFALYTYKAWERLGKMLMENQELDALFIPSIDLFGSFEKATAVNQKWYMVKNKAHIHRGVFAGAIKQDGSIDVNRSDTTECIYNDGSLVRTGQIFDQRMNYIDKLKELQTDKWPFVFHLGSLNLDQRIKQNEYWLPVWENRAGEKVTNIKLDKEQYKETTTFDHKLKYWNVISIVSSEIISENKEL